MFLHRPRKLSVIHIIPAMDRSLRSAGIPRRATTVALVASAAVSLLVHACAVSFHDYPLAVEAGAGGEGGVGGGGAVDPSYLGAACDDSSECGGLTCWTFDAAHQVAGPAGGLCTMGCDDDDLRQQCDGFGGHCHEYDDGTRYCVELCNYAEDDKGKCHGRRDVGCTFDDPSAKHYCQPTCALDGHCPGAVCDRRSLLCTDNPTGGSQQVAEACDPEQDECRGRCLPELSDTCAQRCVFGAPDSCPMAGYCWFTHDGISSHDGNMGACARPCACTDECWPNLVCNASAPPSCDLPDGDATLACKLFEDELLVRYFITSADAPNNELVDTGQGMPPVPLSVGGATFELVGANTALRFIGSSNGYAVSDNLDNGDGLAQGLQGKRTATLEMVVDVTATDPNGGAMPLVFVGAPSDGEPADLGLSVSEHEYQFFLRSQSSMSPVAVWSRAAGKQTLHVVLDTGEEKPEDRVRLFVDGVMQSPQNVGVPPGDTTVIQLAMPQFQLMLGNRPPPANTFDGDIYYVAIYGVALSAAEIQNNHAALSMDDDGPPPG